MSFSPRWILLAILLSWGSVAMAPLTQGAESPRIAIVFTPHETYRQAASAIKAALETRRYSCTLLELPKSGPDADQPGGSETAENPATATAPPSPETRPSATPATASATPLEEARARLAGAKPTLIVTAGTSATIFVLDAIPQTPVIFCMVPNALDMPFLASGSPHRSRLAGVTTDVSPAEQIEWIAKIHGTRAKIGVLCSPRSDLTVKALDSAAKEPGVVIVPIEASKDEFPKAIEALSEKGCDGALMIADASVYNSANIRRLLLWGLRQKKPVWAFSDNIVKAGAFAGLSADNEAIGRQTADLVQEVIGGKAASKIGLQYADRVCLAVNERTADMIGIQLAREVLERATHRFGKDE